LCSGELKPVSADDQMRDLLSSLRGRDGDILVGTWRCTGHAFDANREIVRDGWRTASFGQEYAPRCRRVVCGR
jgi:hypothetical protein